jgi:hypothetical protein
VSPKKNTSPPATAATPTKELKPIRLRPSSSDYATFVRTTADAMGLTGPVASKTKPNRLLLSLANLDS